MYKNLNAESLGISARQNELIELALTYRFRGLDLDTGPLIRQVEQHGRDHAMRYLTSANIKIGGFELPVRWDGDDETYQEDLRLLPQIAEVAADLGATGCTTMVLPYCDDRAYHENFEFHRGRLTEIAETLQPHGICLGLGFKAPACECEGHSSPFITTPDAILTLIKTIVSPNVGLCLDAWHWHVGGGTIEQIQELSADQIVSVRLADLPSDANLPEITEEQRMLPGVTGIVPAAPILSWLHELGYQGPVTAYCHAAQFSGVTRTRAVEQAAQSLTNLMSFASEAADVESDEAAAATEQS